MTAERRAAIGLDIGSSSTKAILLDDRGHIPWTRSIGYRIHRSADGEVTQDPADWLKAARTLLREAASELDGRVPVGIGVTGPAHYAVLLDGADRPMGRALLSSDARPGAIAERLRAELGEAYFRSTRVDLTAGWTLAQLAWLRTQMPERWHEVRRVLVVKDYVRFALTGAAVTDPSDATGTGLYDRDREAWHPDWLEPTGIGEEQLPAIVPAVGEGGALSATWARATGLPAGLPVAVGGTDTAVELVSVGALAAGSSIVKIASTGTVVVVTDKPVADRRLLAYPHVLPGMGYVAAATSTAATAYGWLRETVFGNEPEPPAQVYREMDRLAGRVPAGADGLMFLPFLEGERTPYWDWRLRAGFLGLTSAHRREHLCRAVLEGVALSLRTCRDVVEETGAHVAEPVLSGGGVASRLWRDILVSVLDQGCRSVDPQGPAIGAAMIARAASEGVALTAIKVRQKRSRVEPRQPWRPTYAALSGTYTMAAEALTPLSHRLGEIATARSADDEG